MSARWRGVLMVVIVASASGASACFGGGRGAGPAPLALGDTIRGVLSMVGSEPGAVLVLAPRKGDAVVPRGAELAQLRALIGLEVTIAGRMTDDCVTEGGPRGARVFEMTQFAVRAMNGAGAIDGMLVREGASWMLATSDGRRQPIPILPGALAQQEGARVWFVGTLDGNISAYGVIKAAPR